MRFFEGRTQNEIAEVMGVSQVHVSRLLRGALETIRLELDASEPRA
jgi:RNA polymerase sigma-B factor